jgi:hypothetical protein
MASFLNRMSDFEHTEKPTTYHNESIAPHQTLLVLQSQMAEDLSRFFRISTYATLIFGAELSVIWETMFGEWLHLNSF